MIIQNKIWVCLIFILSSFVIPSVSVAQSGVNFPLSELSIQSGDNTNTFQIEVAANDAQREYGLMFRKSLPENQGMFFIYDQKREITMWMKNTFISLDIIFINDQGEIMRIARSTQPMSVTLIPSYGEAKAVLELNAGITSKLGIEAGDKIIYPLFANTENIQK
ncbi:MAG: DUF192 domain-containing protein [Proteobacteria bacterium]|jgi:uncharacterized protein|nr:DUF192 domain-containing protein [Pseudomonadota bacterium]